MERAGRCAWPGGQGAGAVQHNCNDVFSRECSPAEKADVLAYLLSLKP
jgi:hypothetical protein